MYKQAYTSTTCLWKVKFTIENNYLLIESLTDAFIKHAFQKRQKHRDDKIQCWYVLWIHFMFTNITAALCKHCFLSFKEWSINLIIFLSYKPFKRIERCVFCKLYKRAWTLKPALRCLSSRKWKSWSLNFL